MAELLFEIYCEEIPSRLQNLAARQWETFFAQKFLALDITYSSLSALYTPRRLCIVIKGLEEVKKGHNEERRGPRENAPEKAILGFCESLQLSIEQLTIKDTEKGRFYFADIIHHDIHLKDILPDLIVESIQTLSWPKSMMWGDHDFRFIRPIHNILCLFKGEIVCGGLKLGSKIIPFTDTTFGHPFLSQKQAIKVKNFDDYQQKLIENHVYVDPKLRENMILDQIKKLATPLNLSWQQDQSLLQEVVGLVEYPVVILGNINPHYMALPPKVITTVMKSHQKYIALLDHKGCLAPYFVIVANIETHDNGHIIKKGNERVLSARLADAKFFIEQDLKTPLIKHKESLKNIIFHEDLGTVFDKIERLQNIAEILLPSFPTIHKKDMQRAVALAKTDLCTHLVNELPELQGEVGAYYAAKQNENEDVVCAIKEHYLPLGPLDPTPSNSLSALLALTDKIDNIVSFFAIDQRPTGSKDPFALRRNALGLLRILIDQKLNISLSPILEVAFDTLSNIVDTSKKNKITQDVLSFIRERFNVMLKESFSYDIISSFSHHGENDDFYGLLQKIITLKKFLETVKGHKLVAAFKRIQNIISASQKNKAPLLDWGIRTDHFQQDEEKILYDQYSKVLKHINMLDKNKDFERILLALSEFEPNLCQFFDHVMVNDPDEIHKKNRLKLLAMIHQLMLKNCDLSKIIKNI